MVLQLLPFPDIPEILMNAAPKIVIPVAIVALKFSSGASKWLEFSPSECSCAGPMQHAWQPVSARV